MQMHIYLSLIQKDLVENQIFFKCVYLAILCTYANDGCIGVCRNNKFSNLVEIHNSEMWTLTEKSNSNLN